MGTITSTLYLVASYLLGAIPFGLIFARVLGGVDVRRIGSGNIGATNVLRAVGKQAAILTLLADAMKGAVPVLVAARLFPDGLVPAFAGIAAIIGHNFPIYLRFQGGKGVATSFGVVLAAAPWTGLACLLIWLFSAWTWRYSSLAALIAFTCYPAATFVMRSGERSQETLSLVIFALIYYRHRENIKRLLAGTEPRIGQKA